jgi:uncharacterized membrane protein YdbT with pleckstrin-like domain
MNPNEQSQDPQQPFPQVVHVSRSMEPEKQTVSAETEKRHLESKKQYPRLNLSYGEYVISNVKRSPVGLAFIWLFTGIIITALVAFATILLTEQKGSAEALLALPLLFVTLLVFIGGAISTYVYQANTFYLTNESVIQNIQHGLFNKRLQTVSLGNIEDASYMQNGILAHIFNYGSLRLSTEGEETTYRFDFVSNPETQKATLNNAVEAFKLGRPVEG